MEGAAQPVWTAALAPCQLIHRGQYQDPGLGWRGLGRSLFEPKGFLRARQSEFALWRKALVGLWVALGVSGLARQGPHLTVTLPGVAMVWAVEQNCLRNRLRSEARWWCWYLLVWSR